MDLNSGLRLLSVRGIAIRVHWSWSFIFALLAWSLATRILPEILPDAGDAVRWAVAFATSAVFFLSVLLHELSHAIVAQRAGMKVPSITLFIFGGVSNIEGEMRTPGEEFRIAIAGPATSALLGLLLLGLWAVVSIEGRDVLFYLGATNVVLAVFNLLPGFPLDGGRVLRSIVWARTGDLATATRVASTVGRLIAWSMIAIGVYVVLTIGLVGLWYILIGFYLKSASEAAYGAMILERALEGVRIADVMRPPPVPVEAHTNLSRIIEERVLGQGERAIFIERDGRVAGLITTSDLARVPREQHASTLAAEAMVPAESIVTAPPDLPLLEALRLMVERDIHQVPVIEDGRMVGLVSRADVIQQIEARQRLGPRPPGR